MLNQFTNEQIAREEWRDIPGFTNYQASTLGRFRRPLVNGRFRMLTGKIDHTGYQQFGPVKDGNQHWHMAHRLIAATWLEVPEYDGTYLTVNHKNRVKTDNRIENLEMVSNRDNQTHWRKHRRLQDLGNQVSVVPVP